MVGDGGVWRYENRNDQNYLVMKPDVCVVARDQTVLFAPQNLRASEWLHRRCGLAVENISGDTEIRIHPRRCQNIIAELKAAGFSGAGQIGELC